MDFSRPVARVRTRENTGAKRESVRHRHSSQRGVPQHGNVVEPPTVTGFTEVAGQPEPQSNVGMTHVLRKIHLFLHPLPLRAVITRLAVGLCSVLIATLRP